MAVQRQENWLGQQRVDIPHLRSIESGFVADMDVLAGLMLAEGQPLIVRGFDLLGSIGSVATALQVNVASASLIHYFATENGSIFAVPANRLPETLASTNTKVTGSFTPSSVNYIGLDLRRSVDNTTADLVQFLDANTLLEIPKTVPLARTLDYIISVSTSDFSSTPTIAPIAKVTTDAANNVVLIEDARQLFFRLGIGGSIPNRKNAYTWPQTKAENLTGNVFFGGDKSITGLKSSLNAMMTRIWELGGGEYWYSGTADRNVKMFRSGMVLPNGEYFSWDGTNLTWRGLTFIFPNSSGLYNDIKDQLVALPGLTDLAEGECIYVDLDYSQTRTNPNGLQAIKTNTQLLGNPTIPGERNIVAWRLNNVIFTRDSYFPVGGIVINPATTFSLGVVALSKAPTSALFPIVLTNTEKNAASGVAALDVSKNVIGAGLGRDVLLGAGVLTIGVSTRDKQIVLNGDGTFNSTAVQVVDAANKDTKGDYVESWYSQASLLSTLDNKGVFTTPRTIVNNVTAHEDATLVDGGLGFTIVTHTGTGTGTVTPSGNCGTNNIYFILIVTSGGLGVGQFKLSVDGGLNYGATLTIPGGGIYQDPVNLITLTFTGSFITQDVYWFKPLYSPLEVFIDHQNNTHALADHTGFPMGRRTEIREEWSDPNGFGTTSSKWATSVTGAGFTAGIIDAGSSGTTTQLYKFPVPTLSIESNTNATNDQYFALTRGKIFYPQSLNVYDIFSPSSNFSNSVAEWETQTDVNVGNNSEYFMGWGDSILSGTPTAAIYFHQKNQGNWEAVTIGNLATNVVTTAFGVNPTYNFPYRFRIETTNTFVPALLSFVEDVTYPQPVNPIFSMFNYPTGNIQWLTLKTGSTYYKSGGTWTQKNLTNTTANNIANAIWASSDTLGAAVAGTSLGYFDRYDAGMNQWVNTKAPVATTVGMAAMHGTSQNDVWMVGAGGKIMHYNGEWTNVASPTTNTLGCVWALSPTDAWAGGNANTLIHWDGTSWTSMSTGFTGGSANGIWAAATNDVYVVSTNATYHWNGTSWTSVDVVSGLCIWGFAANNIWVAFTNSQLKHWDGTSWSSVSSSLPLTGTITSIWGIAANDIWAVTNGHAAARTIHYDGVSWSSAPSPPLTLDNKQVFGFSSTEVVIFSSNSAAISVWNGTSWSAAINFNAVGTLGLFGWGTSLDSLWVTEGGSDIFNKNHPKFSTDDNYQHIRSMWGSASNDIWSVGFVGRMFHFDGTSWSPVGAITGKDLYAIWGTASNNIWAVGNKGFIQHWDGTNWTSVASSTTKNLLGIMGSNASNIWAVGYDPITNHSDIIFFNGTSWSIVNTQLNTQLGQVAVISSSSVYFTSGPYIPPFAAGTHINIVRYNGVSYTSVTPPLVGAIPVTYIYAGGLMNGTLYVGAEDGTGNSHLFALLTSSGYVNTARFFINENLVAEIMSNVPGGVPLKFQFGAKSGATNTKIRMQNSPLLINIGRYNSTPQL